MSRQKPYKQMHAKQKVQTPGSGNRGLWLALIGAIILLAAVVVGVLIFLNNNNQPTQASTGGTGSDSFTTVQKQDWPSPNRNALGPATASVTVLEFADYQCPYCKIFDQTVQPNIIKDYVKTGKVRYEFHTFNVIDMNTGGVESQHAAMAALCAANQGDFWDYHEMLYTNQQGEATGAFNDNRLKQFAAALKLDTAKFNTCLDGQQTKGQVTADEALAKTLNISSTPSLFVNGKGVTNPMDYDTVKAAIDAALGTSK